MGYTTAYQEASNNYTNTNQTIKGRQIPSVIFGMIDTAEDKPNIPADHEGQFFLGQDTGANKMRLWIKAGAGLTGGWKELSIPDVPSDMVRKMVANNFEHYHQTIKDNQIVSVEVKPKTPTAHPGSAPNYDGQFYIDSSSTEKPVMYIGYNGFWWNMEDLYYTEHDVKLDEPNNFTDTAQTIKGRPIVSAIVSPNAPTLAPDYIGQVFFQYEPGTTSKKASMWVASGTTLESWRLVTEDSEIPEHIVTTNKINNFTEVEQYINHNQIMTMIDGGYKLPNAGIKLDFDGQLFVTRKNESVDDFAAWMGFKNNQGENKWLPIFHEGNLPGNVAILDKSNTFDEPLQYIRDEENQPGEQTRIIGCRQLGDGEEVKATKPIMIGEVVLKQSPPNVGDPDMGNQWEVHVGTAHRRDGYTQLANVKHPNLWHERQYMGDMTRAMTGCRVIDNHPIEHNEAPATAGEICIHKRTTNGKVYRDIYIARTAADANSWVKIFDGQYQEVAKLEESNNFTNRHQYLGEYDESNMANYECIPGVRNVTTEVKGNITPTRRGEIVIQEKALGGGMTEFTTYMSVRECNKDAWTVIASSTIMV